MPFTLAHPALVLPLPRWRGLALAPLVAGSLAPDAPYFLPDALTRDWPSLHFWPWLVTAAPLAAYLLLAFAVLARSHIAAALWGGHRTLWLAALDPLASSPMAWVWALPAIAIGIASHVLWDSFTHAYGWFVQHSSALQASVVLPHVPGEWSVYKLLQWGSSLAGLAAIAWFHRRALRRFTANSESRADGSGEDGNVARYRLRLLLLALVACAVGWLRLHWSSLAPEAIHGRAFLGSTTAVDVFICLVLLVGSARLRKG